MGLGSRRWGFEAQASSLAVWPCPSRSRSRPVAADGCDDHARVEFVSAQLGLGERSAFSLFI